MSEPNTATIRSTLRFGQSQRDPALVKEAAEQFRKIDDAAGEAECYDTLGEMRFSAGSYEESANYYRQSMRIYQTIGQRANEAKSHFSLSRCLAFNKNQENPLPDDDNETSHLKDALQIASEISERDLQVQCCIALGACYRNAHPDASRDYYQSALKLLEPMPKGWLSAQCHQSLAQFFAGSNDSIKARRHYLAAIEDYEEARNDQAESIPQRLAQCHESIGDLALREVDEDEAIERFKESLRLLEEIQSRNAQRVREKLEQLLFDD
jgi:tetratricopeptide (TPR) repeat protein